MSHKKICTNMVNISRAKKNRSNSLEFNCRMSHGKLKHFPHHMRGISLIEVIISMIVMGIVFALAVPNFTLLIHKTHLSNSVNDLVTALNVAKISGIRGLPNVVVCEDATCSVKSTSNLSTIELRGPISNGDGIVQVTNVKNLKYNAMGQAILVGEAVPYTGLVADIYIDSLKKDNHRCLYMDLGGSIINTCSSTERCSNVQPKRCNK